MVPISLVARIWGGGLRSGELKQMEIAAGTLLDEMRHSQQTLEFSKKFSQIKLLEFHNQTLCTDPESPWTKSYRGDPKSKLLNFPLENYSNMLTVC